jgi:outer membrane protein assembly factor BamB
VSPLFGGVPQHLHVGVGHVRPPFRRDWVSGGTSLVEFPPAIGFHYLYYATLTEPGRRLDEERRRLWTVHVGRCEAASPAVDRLGRGSVYETFLNKHPCGGNAAKRGDGELLVVAAGPSHRLRWRKHLGATETSPLIVGNRIFVGDAEGNVYCLVRSTARRSGRSHGRSREGSAGVRPGRLFFGAYDGRLYALRATDGKQIWRSSPRATGSAVTGTFYSTPRSPTHRVYLGSTDGHVYSFGEQSGKLRWSHGTGGSSTGRRGLARPHLRRLVQPYFFAFDAATGEVLWKFHRERPDLRLRDRRRRHRLLRDPRAPDLRARRSSGKEVWTYPDGAFTPVVTDGQRLYVVGWGKVYAFSTRGGEVESASSGR